MPDTYDIVEISDASQWDDFVRLAPGGSVFSTSAWLRCAQEAVAVPFRCFGCVKNGQLVAGVSGLEQRRRFFTRFTTPELTPHGGFLFAPVPSKGPAKIEAEWNRAAALLIDYLTRRYPHIQLFHSPSITDLREFLWAGWITRIRYTYQMDLTDLDALWERVERRTRTVIRKAEKANFQLFPTDDLDLFRHQYEQIYTRQDGPPPVNSAVVQRFAREAIDADLAEARAITSPAGEVASIVIFVRGFDTAYAWVAGADPAFNSTGATSLLYWKYFSQTPFPKFDFVGANLPPIAKFKRGFGGDLIPYHTVEGFGSSTLKKIFTLKRILAE